jgi:predicted RNase H-like HicB family nuclease
MMNEREIPKYSMTIEWSPDDDAFIVTIPELAGSRTHGASYTEAAKNGQEIIELVVEGLVQDGQEIPAPSYFENGELVDLHSHRDRKAVRRAS